MMGGWTHWMHDRGDIMMYILMADDFEGHSLDLMVLGGGCMRCISGASRSGGMVQSRQRRPLCL